MGTDLLTHLLFETESYVTYSSLKDDLEPDLLLVLSI